MFSSTIRNIILKHTVFDAESTCVVDNTAVACNFKPCEPVVCHSHIACFGIFGISTDVLDMEFVPCCNSHTAQSCRCACIVIRACYPMTFALESEVTLDSTDRCIRHISKPCKCINIFLHRLVACHGICSG